MLHSLLRQSYRDFDVAILDDGGGQPLQAAKYVSDALTALKLRGHDVQVLRNDFPMGVCKSRQRLVDEDPWPGNPLIARIDDDVVLEPDYLERLSGLISGPVGIATGVTPLFGVPGFVRETRFVRPVVNRIGFDMEGNISTYSDDCGYSYDVPDILPAHQFRSMALFNRKVFENVRYPVGTSQVGFREEAWISLDAAWNGWKCVVDLAAIGWHAPCPTGGTRSDPAAYQRNVMADHEKFLSWAKRQYLRRGLPAAWQ